MTDFNKRKFPRAYYPCYLTLWLENKFDTIFTRTVNISAGGVLVSLDQGLQVGVKTDVRIEFAENISFDCCGRILRCMEEEGKKIKYSVAVVFEGLDEDKVSRLKEHIDRLLLKEKDA